MDNNRYREEEKEDIIRELEENENKENSEKLSKKEKKNEKKIEELLKEIETLKKENEETKKKYLSSLAECENFKKRVEEERVRERKYSSQRLLEKIMGPIDILSQASNMKTDNDVLKNFLIGFQMIDSQIHNILEEEGVKKIVVEKMFDPRFHHAVETDWNPEKEENEILAVLKDGYMYKDRVLFATLVKVNKKPEIKEEKQEEENK